jgi:hypothetical protein
MYARAPTVVDRGVKITVVVVLPAGRPISTKASDAL